MQPLHGREPPCHGGFRRVLDRALGDPADSLASVPGPLALDEVQRAPEMLLAIRAAVDRNRRPGRFLLLEAGAVVRCPVD